MAHPVKNDEFVSKIVTDPKNPPNTLLLKGFIGASSEAGHIRLYMDSALSDYVEIPESAVLYAQQLTKEESPLGGSNVWIQRDASLIHGPILAARPKASFLEGRIMTTHACAVQGRPFLPKTVMITCTDVGPCPTDACTNFGPKCHTQTVVTCPAPCPIPTQSGTTCPAPCPTPTLDGPNCPTTPGFTCSGPSCPTTADTTCCGPLCPTFPANTCGGPNCPTVSGTTCPAPTCTQSGPSCPTTQGTTCPAPCPTTQSGPSCPTHFTCGGPHCQTIDDPSCPFPTEIGKSCVGPCIKP